MLPTLPSPKPLESAQTQCLPSLKLAGQSLFFDPSLFQRLWPANFSEGSTQFLWQNHSFVEPTVQEI